MLIVKESITLVFMNDYYDVLNMQLSAQMVSRGVSGAELGRLMGLSRQAVSNRRTGRVKWTAEDVERLKRLGYELNVEVELAS